MSQSASLHVAIVMDGNGRWARRRGLPRVAGHRAGAEAVRRTVEAAPDSSITALTLYAFSADNWKRPPGEVAALMRLLARYLRTETPRLLENGVRLDVVGRRDRLPAPLVAAIGAAEQATARGTRLRLRLAVGYSARRAVTPRAILPDVDLLIRTGGVAGASPPRGGQLRRPMARGRCAPHRLELRRPRLEDAPGIRHDRPGDRPRGRLPEHPGGGSARSAGLALPARRLRRRRERVDRGVSAGQP